jgi:SAM-dependent methyltransferase
MTDNGAGASDALSPMPDRLGGKSGKRLEMKAQVDEMTPRRGPVVTVDDDREMRQLSIERRVYNESRIAGFSHLDHEIGFFTQVAALLRPDDVVLDFGAGRGSWYYDDPCRYRRWIQNFRGRCQHVDGCDVDPVVLENESLDRALVLLPGEPLPYEDDRFDLVVSRYVFEHLPDPEWAARELLRVTKPGGWICALTPNKWGYVALASRMVPNKLHRAVLKVIQPHRHAEDVFSTCYKLNRPKDVRRHFGHMADLYHYSSSGVPSYHFGSILLFRITSLMHRLLPPILDNGLRFFIQKHAETGRAGLDQRPAAMRDASSGA